MESIIPSTSSLLGNGFAMVYRKSLYFLGIGIAIDATLLLWLYLELFPKEPGD